MKIICFLCFAVCLLLHCEAQAVSILYTEQSTPGVAADASTIKGLNIDVVMNYYPGNSIPTVTELTAYLDALQGAGLKGMIDLAHKFQNSSPDYALLDTVIAGVKGHPALYGWYMQDEPTSTSCPLAVRQTLYSHIKAIDPDHPVLEVFPGYGSGFWPSGDGNVAQYSAAVHNLFGVDNYPVGTGGTYSASTFQSELTGSYNATATGDRGNFIGLTQAWGGGAYAMPTATQMQSIASVISSTGWATKGMAFWIWHVDPALYSGMPPGSTYLKNHSELWSTVAAIATPYHENLYVSAPAPTAASTATMRASFR